MAKLFNPIVDATLLGKALGKAQSGAFKLRPFRRYHSYTGLFAVPSRSHINSMHALRRIGARVPWAHTASRIYRVRGATASAIGGALRSAHGAYAKGHPFFGNQYVRGTGLGMSRGMARGLTKAIKRERARRDVFRSERRSRYLAKLAKLSNVRRFDWKQMN